MLGLLIDGFFSSFFKTFLFYETDFLDFVWLVLTLLRVTFDLPLLCEKLLILSYILSLSRALDSISSLVSSVFSFLAVLHSLGFFLTARSLTRLGAWASNGVGRYLADCGALTAFKASSVHCFFKELC